MEDKVKFNQEYEVRLLGAPGSQLIFVTSKSCDDEAVEHARKLMDRHPSYMRAEVWQGMKIVRRV
jgi:hypothetical protein